ncbi:hypothetical protein BS50DRAFT_7790 [Corynespora cassiicola Philippines]|uniref:Zn(2)-C6 fungal-type domain-containing protein n=1 Tax=Corynespora cassiicola Philippines TaxID=1448308 RepID=A0A2T2P8X0_CORCC|nr:hypothetical protein BS50DRAFT_7790 [Corynespora cassiicola Philippines]
MPKRSTGCFECRKRKVRCDEAKPECHTCLRRGTKCPGYRPAQSFILHAFDDKHDRPAIIREDEERYRYANHRRDSPTEYSSGTGSPEARAVVPVQRAEDGLVEPHVPRQVSPVAIDRVQHLGTFLSLYLPKWEGEALPPPSALVLSLPTLPASSHVLLASVDALSAAQLAVNDKNLNHINRSRSLYGTALSQMMKAIQTPKTALEDETLLATYLLTLYEVFVGVTNGHGFFYHVQGLLHCFRQRGPSSFNTRLSMQIFHAVRYNSVRHTPLPCIAFHAGPSPHSRLTLSSS